MTDGKLALAVTADLLWTCSALAAWAYLLNSQSATALEKACLLVMYTKIVFSWRLDRWIFRARERL